MENPDTVTLTWAEYERLLDRIEDAEDTIAALEHDLEAATGNITPGLTRDEVERRLADWAKSEF